MTRKKTTHEFDYYVLLFFGLAFIGWLWEVGLYLATEHAFINRGVYRGPYLPIYGAGGLALCLLLRPLRRKPVRVFLLFYQLVPGAALGHPLVGLQRARLESERADLSAGSCGLRPGRHGAGLSAAAAV